MAMNKKINKVVIAVVLAIDLILAVVLGLAVSWMMAIPFAICGLATVVALLGKKAETWFYITIFVVTILFLLWCIIDML